MTFKEAAIAILKEAQKPLHYRDITARAITKGFIRSEGKTPWATLNAQLSMDVVEKGEGSEFVRTKPGYFGLSKKVTREVRFTTDALVVYGKINQNLSSKQKGDIAEARVAELITLYGEEGLSCYRPVSDDEGIDLIVKRRGQLDVTYVQVKSTFGYRERGFVSSVEERTIEPKQRMLLVFVYFDLTQGDIYDHVFCVPAPDFLKLSKNEKRKSGKRVFTVGLRNPDQSKYAEFMIEKRELANRVTEIMDKL